MSAKESVFSKLFGGGTTFEVVHTKKDMEKLSNKFSALRESGDLAGYRLDITVVENNLAKCPPNSPPVSYIATLMPQTLRVR